MKMFTKWTLRRLSKGRCLKGYGKCWHRLKRASYWTLVKNGEGFDIRQLILLETSVDGVMIVY
jgi:hypothetical protein